VHRRNQAAEELVEEMQYDLWKAIEEMEFCLKEKTFILVKNVKPVKANRLKLLITHLSLRRLQAFELQWIENTSNGVN